MFNKGTIKIEVLFDLEIQLYGTTWSNSNGIIVVPYSLYLDETWLLKSHDEVIL